MQTDEGKRKKKKEKKVGACLANKKWSLNFHHSSLITHHSIFHIRLPSSLSFHHSLFFTLFGGPTPVIVQLFFFPLAASSFFFFPPGLAVRSGFFFFTGLVCSVLFFFFSLVPRLTKLSEKKKKKNCTVTGVGLQIV